MLYRGVSHSPAEALGLSVQLSLRVRAAVLDRGGDCILYKMVLQVFALVIEFWTQFIYGNHIEKGMPS